MNPEQISIPDCTLDDPVKKSSGKISFCLIPCLHNGERLQVKLPTRFQNLFPFRFFLSRDFNSRKFPEVFQGFGETFECFGDEKNKRSCKK